ncbi:AAA family ATPase [Phenylobacterium hankyongense]|nr:AAA family ATPase [Phenylobacterium hankyongense]
MEAAAADTKPLLGRFVVRGQATMIYAEPNAGKTLIVLNLCLDAIARRVIDPDNVYYINADDSSQGVATKLRLMQDAGAHVLVPGYGPFKTHHLAEMLDQAVAQRTALGTLVIIDTYKKFTDLMDKRRTSVLNQVCRQYVMAGGTVVALGHTAKNPNADGTPRYQGGTDVLEDFDAVYVGRPIIPKAGADERVVKFTRIKCRADSPEDVAYAYATTRGIGYDEKVASVQAVDPDDYAAYATYNGQVGEGEIMAALMRLIRSDGAVGKMELARAVAKECAVSQRVGLDVLNRYTGTVPREHLWTFETGAHGRRTYRLIDQAKPSP